MSNLSDHSTNEQEVTSNTPAQLITELGLMPDLDRETWEWIKYRAAHYKISPKKYIERLIYRNKVIQENGVNGDLDSLRFFPSKDGRECKGTNKHLGFTEPFL